jgi:hypothetical protein
VLDDETVRRQCGVVTRAQALAAGLTVEGIRARIGARRWQPLFRSVYATFSGPVPRDALRWAAVLRAGDRAVLSHHSAAELIGLADADSPLIHVTVPADRRIRPIRGIAVHHSHRIDAARHPVRTPPQTRVEETVIDLTQVSASLEEAAGWITRACGRRFTRPERVAATLALRKKARWRAELLGVLADVGGGAHSPLELRYLRDVERAHGLPPAVRQHAVRGTGATRYEDVRYAEFGVVVELDGRAAHTDDARWRDMRRDNASVVAGRWVLRYGWSDVGGSPCAVAAQVATVLQAAGWPGQPRPCRPDCPMIMKTSRGYNPTNSS